MRYPVLESIEEILGPPRHAVTIEPAHNDYEDGPAGAAAFLGWPIVLECEASAETTPHDVVTAICNTLQTLWERGIPAIAACDFEDELPDPPVGLGSA
ncbi:hypothetical protein ACN24L_26355 [Streptomyces microflavus]